MRFDRQISMTKYEGREAIFKVLHLKWSSFENYGRSQLARRRGLYGADVVTIMQRSGVDRGAQRRTRWICRLRDAVDRVIEWFRKEQDHFAG